MAGLEKLEKLPIVGGAISAGLDVCKTVPWVIESANSFFKDIKVTDFQSRYRSLELVVVNATEHKLSFQKEYFSSGRWFTALVPLDIQPGEAAIGLVANRQYAWAGVCGGVEYSLTGTPYNLYIGFTNPYMGAAKNFIDLAKSESPYWAYSNAEDDSIKSIEHYGYQMRCTRHISENCPFGKFQFTIAKAETE